MTELTGGAALLGGEGMTEISVAVELELTEGPVSGTLAITYAGVIIWQAGERTGVHPLRRVRRRRSARRRGTSRTITPADACAMSERYPFAGDQLSGFRPIDRPEVRGCNRAERHTVLMRGDLERLLWDRIRVQPTLTGEVPRDGHS